MSLNETARKTETSRWPGILLLGIVIAAFSVAILIYQGNIIGNQVQIKAQDYVLLQNQDNASRVRAGSLSLQEAGLHNQVLIAKSVGAKGVTMGPPLPKPAPLKAFTGG
jgi:hypothetical protein